MCVYGAAAQSKWPPEGIFQEPIARMVANQAVEVPIPEPEVAKKERARHTFAAVSWTINGTSRQRSQTNRDDAAARLQALYRGRRSRQEFVHTVEAATKVQALVRLRCKPSMFATRPALAPHKDSPGDTSVPEVRPQASWDDLRTYVI